MTQSAVLTIVTLLDDDIAARLPPICRYLRRRYRTVNLLLFDRFRGKIPYAMIVNSLHAVADNVAVFSTNGQWQSLTKEPRDNNAYLFLFRHNHILPHNLLLLFLYLRLRCRTKAVNLFSLPVIRASYRDTRHPNRHLPTIFVLAIVNFVLYSLFLAQNILAFHILFRPLHILLRRQDKFHHRPTDPKRILFSRMDHLGDIICSMPSLAALRRTYPRSRITILAAPWNAAPLKANPHLYDELILWSAPWHNKATNYRLGLVSLYRFLRLLSRLWRMDFDLVIQPRGEGMNVAVAALCRAKYVVSGIDRLRPLSIRMQRYIDLAVEYSPYETIHIASWAERCLAALGIQVSKEDIRQCYRRPEDPAISRAVAALREEGFAVCSMVIAAGSPIRQWPALKFARLIEALRARKIAAVLIGTQADQPFVSEINALCQVPFVNLAGKTTFANLPWLLHCSDHVISLDTSIMHMASLLGKRVVAIFGAGKLGLARPVFSDHAIVKKELGCSGCGDDCLYQKKTPPPCLRLIAPSDVFDRLDSPR